LFKNFKKMHPDATKSSANFKAYLHNIKSTEKIMKKRSPKKSKSPRRSKSRKSPKKSKSPRRSKSPKKAKSPRRSKSRKSPKKSKSPKSRKGRKSPKSRVCSPRERNACTRNGKVCNPLTGNCILPTTSVAYGLKVETRRMPRSRKSSQPIVSPYQSMYTIPQYTPPPIPSGKPAIPQYTPPPIPSGKPAIPQYTPPYVSPIPVVSPYQPSEVALADKPEEAQYEQLLQILRASMRNAEKKLADIKAKKTEGGQEDLATTANQILALPVEEIQAMSSVDPSTAKRSLESFEQQIAQATNTEPLNITDPKIAAIMEEVPDEIKNNIVYSGTPINSPTTNPFSGPMDASMLLERVQQQKINNVQTGLEMQKLADKIGLDNEEFFDAVENTSEELLESSEKLDQAQADVQADPSEENVSALSKLANVSYELGRQAVTKVFAPGMVLLGLQYGALYLANQLQQNTGDFPVYSGGTYPYANMTNPGIGFGFKRKHRSRK
jgi:hypothetical protein